MLAFKKKVIYYNRRIPLGLLRAGSKARWGVSVSAMCLYLCIFLSLLREKFLLELVIFRCYSIGLLPKKQPLFELGNWRPYHHRLKICPAVIDKRQETWQYVFKKKSVTYNLTFDNSNWKLRDNRWRYVKAIYFMISTPCVRTLW